MLGLVQRVSRASVSIKGSITGEIDQGILLLLGVQKNDSNADVEKLLQKVLSYRIFSDDEEKMNLSLSDVGGGLLIVSQFTLAADTKKAKPDHAEFLYDHFVAQAARIHPVTQSGIFGANMQVSLCNDGPVTFMLSS